LPITNVGLTSSGLSSGGSGGSGGGFISANTPVRNSSYGSGNPSMDDWGEAIVATKVTASFLNAVFADFTGEVTMKKAAVTQSFSAVNASLRNITAIASDGSSGSGVNGEMTILGGSIVFKSGIATSYNSISNSKTGFVTIEYLKDLTGTKGQLTINFTNGLITGTSST